MIMYYDIDKAHVFRDTCECEIVRMTIDGVVRLLTDRSIPKGTKLENSFPFVIMTVLSESEIKY